MCQKASIHLFAHKPVSLGRGIYDLKSGCSMLRVPKKTARPWSWKIACPPQRFFFLKRKHIIPPRLSIDVKRPFACQDLVHILRKHRHALCCCTPCLSQCQLKVLKFVTRHLSPIFYTRGRLCCCLVSPNN